MTTHETQTAQKRTSAGTSINAQKLPRIYKAIRYILEGQPFIDYGCGRYTAHLKAYAESIGAEAHFFDPYNQPDSVNRETEAFTGAAFSICSNVLNVIDSDRAVTECIAGALRLGNGRAFFTVYEGDGSGRGAETQNGQSWQRNARLRDYARFAPEGCKVTLRVGVMEVTRG